MKRTVLRKIVAVTEQFRSSYPYCYRLDCGHYFYGKKARWVGRDLVHQKRMRCNVCSDGFAHDDFQTQVEYDEGGPHHGHRWQPC